MGGMGAVDPQLCIWRRPIWRGWRRWKHLGKRRKGDFKADTSTSYRWRNRYFLVAYTWDDSHP